MATITPTLTITSTDASADETLSLSVTKGLTTGQVFKGSIFI